MWLRTAVVVTLAVVLMLGQTLARYSAGSGERASDTTAGLVSTVLTQRASAQNDDNDNAANDDCGDDNDNVDENDNSADDHCGDDGDNSDGDNNDGDGDNNDGNGDNNDGDDDDDDDDNDNGGDDDDDDNDNGDDNENGNDNAATTGIQAPVAARAPELPPTPTPIPVTPTATPFPTRTPVPTAVPTTQDQAVTTGGDLQVVLSGDRVVVQVFSTIPSGITLTLRLIDPATEPAVPGTLAGDLMFRIEARDQQGAVLSLLPAEVNLSIRYTDADVAGRDDAGVTLARLDPGDNRWQTASRLLVDPEGNFLAASITELGTYAVYLP